jgi:hypothetical protein
LFSVADDRNDEAALDGNGQAEVDVASVVAETGASIGSSSRTPEPAPQRPRLGAARRPEVRRDPRVTRGSTDENGGDGSPYALDEEKYPTLAALGRNLTEVAARGQLEPLVGRRALIGEARHAQLDLGLAHIGADLRQAEAGAETIEGDGGREAHGGAP